MFYVTLYLLGSLINNFLKKFISFQHIFLRPKITYIALKLNLYSSFLCAYLDIKDRPFIPIGQDPVKLMRCVRMVPLGMIKIGDAVPDGRLRQVLPVGGHYPPLVQ